MFTRTFRKPALALAALFTAVVLYACFAISMNRLSLWAEQDLGAHPFKQEDWLRYFLPSKFELPAQQRILIAGPSTVRENLLYERFEEAYPEYLVVQGGLSLGTLDDVTASLNYIREVYGEEALPTLLVLGISPRFIANLPADRPLADGINQYSPYRSAVQNTSGIQLADKGLVAALASRARFQIRKQPERYRTTLFAIANQLLSGEPAMRGLDHLLRHPQFRRFLASPYDQRVLNYPATELLAWLFSPYKYRLDAPVGIDGLTEWMDADDSWWRAVHTWNPRRTRQATLAALERLNTIVREHAMQLVIINMPERNISRARYDRDNYRAYLELVSEGLGGSPVLDLQTFLEDEEFHDLEHSTLPGSERLTRKIIKNMTHLH